MADDAIVSACANPILEIFPWDAREVGARVVARVGLIYQTKLIILFAFPEYFEAL